MSRISLVAARLASALAADQRVSRLRQVADAGDLVAVEIADICAVVVGVVVRAEPGRAAAGAAGGQGRRVKGADGRSVLGDEGDGLAIAGGSGPAVDRAHEVDMRGHLGARGIADEPVLRLVRAKPSVAMTGS